MEQENYPPPAEITTDDLAATVEATVKELHRTQPLLAFLSSEQRKTLGTLHEAVGYPEATLLHSYVEESIPLHTGKQWSSRTLETATTK